MRKLLPLLTGVLLLAACGGGSGKTTLSIQSKLAPVSIATGVPAWRWVRPASQPAVQPTDAEVQELCAALGSQAEEPPPIVVRGLKKGWLEYRVVEVSRHAIRTVHGDVVPLDGGTVRVDYLNGTLISALYDVLHAASDASRARAEACAEWSEQGELLLAVDRRVPFETVSAVLYTAMQARYERIAFMVRDPRPTSPPDLAADANLEAILVITSDGSIEVAHAGAPEGAHSPGVAELGVALDTVLGGRANLGCAAVVPYMDVPWSLVSATLDELAALGVSQPMIGLSGKGLSAALPDTDPLPAELFEPAELLAVLRVAPPGSDVGRGTCSGPPITPAAPEEPPPAAD